MAVLIESIASRLLDAKVHFSVAVPQNITRGERLPVIYVLHGMVRWEAFTGTPMERSFFKKMTQGKSRQFSWVNGFKVRSFQDHVDAMRAIVVNVNGGQSWYVDSPYAPGGRYESHLIQELIPFVDSRYPTRRGKRARALVGHSMGGYGALMLLCKYPELFWTAGLRAAALPVCQDSYYDPKLHIVHVVAPVFGPKKDRKFRDSQEPLLWIEKLKGLERAVHLDVGIFDLPVLVEANRAMHQKMMELQLPHTYRETYDGHESQPYMGEMMTWAAALLNRKVQRTP
jgi:enterochelin esterase-like enzyme